ncbi:MAG: hypothetical protein HY556_06370 [Euryarchaeota archaeon]|nr:hypothetical protein [Euryarchaeota archaeon]
MQTPVVLETKTELVVVTIHLQAVKPGGPLANERFAGEEFKVVTAESLGVTAD